MQKFHINRETDRVNKCDAKTNESCPVGGAHFENKEEAIEYKDATHKKANPAVATLKKKRGPQLATRLRDANGKVSNIKREIRDLNNEKTRLMEDNFGKELVKNSPAYKEIQDHISRRKDTEERLKTAKEEAAVLQKEFDQKNKPKESQKLVNGVALNRGFYSGGGCGGGGSGDRFSG